MKRKESNNEEQGCDHKYMPKHPLVTATKEFISLEPSDFRNVDDYWKRSQQSIRLTVAESNLNRALWLADTILLKAEDRG